MKDWQDLYIEKYKTQLRDIKEFIINEEIYHNQWLEDSIC